MAQWRNGAQARRFEDIAQWRNGAMALKLDVSRTLRNGAMAQWRSSLPFRGHRSIVSGSFGPVVLTLQGLIRSGEKPVSNQQQLDLALGGDNDSPLCGTCKNERDLMAFNFFSLTREHQTSLPVYDDGRYRIEVKGTEDGVATIWDKEMLIYLISLMQERMNRSEKMNRVFRFTGHDFFRINGTKPNGNAYIRIEQSLDRLKSTTIKTNLLDDDGKGGHTAAFSWIDDYDILWRENKNGDRSMKSVTVALSSRLYDAILNNKRILTYDAAYFQLKPLEKRLYEIARAHVGQQKAFRMNLEKLRLRVGIQTTYGVLRPASRRLPHSASRLCPVML